MIARSEAHDSGLCAANLATRRRFATDLLNLTLAGPRVNRYEKVDHDAAEWLPPQNRCWFAARVIAVRRFPFSPVCSASTAWAKGPASRRRSSRRPEALVFEARRDRADLKLHYASSTRLPRATLATSSANSRNCPVPSLTTW